MANKGARLPVSIPSDLTPRQREVLGLIAEGRTNFDIAQRLGISLEGVKYHVSEILQRLEVDSREEAAEAWRRENAPMRRVSRGIAAMSPLRLAAWVAGSVVAAAVVGFVIFAVVSGMGGEDEDGGVATPTSVVAEPTATPGAEPPRLVSCPEELDDEVCDFAAAAEEWVRAGDVASLIGGGPFDTPTTRSDLEQLLAGGPGGPWTLRSVACPYVRGEPPEPSCSERFALVFSTFDLDGAGVDQAAMVAISYDRAAGGPEIQAYGLPDLDWQHSLIAWPLTQGDTLPGTMGGLGFRVHPVEVLPPGQPTPTPVPAVEVIDGVAVRELVVGAETTLPDDLVVYIQPVRWASESNPGLIRDIGAGMASSGAMTCLNGRGSSSDRWRL